jgi:hypothetical protein
MDYFTIAAVMASVFLSGITMGEILERRHQRKLKSTHE